MKPIILLFLFFQLVYAQNYLDIENKILSFQFLKADSLIKKLQNTPQKIYLHHHNLFYQQFFYENFQAEQFFLKSDSLIHKLSYSKGSEEWKVSFLGEMYLERCIISFLQKSYWNAYKNFKESYKLVQKTKNFSQIIFPKRLQSLIEIFLGSIPTKYKWITDFMGYSGNLEKGIHNFHQIINKTEILKIENQVLNFYLSKHLFNDHQSAYHSIEKLNKNYPENSFFAYLLGINYLDRKELQKAKQKLIFCIKHPIKDFDYPAYHLAHCYMYELQLDSAQYFLEKFIEKKRGNIFKADANYKIGILYSFKNQKNEAQKYFYRATQFDEQISDKDLYAIKQSQNYIFKSISKEEAQLFQARWLFDGGNYSQSLTILNQISYSNIPDISIEILYRKARVYHEMKNLDKALEFYQKVFEIQSFKNLWMKPYSAYFIALIYDEKKDYTKVKFFLNKSLSYKNYDFQASLEQKVKTKLSKILH